MHEQLDCLGQLPFCFLSGSLRVDMYLCMVWKWAIMECNKVLKILKGSERLVCVCAWVCVSFLLLLIGMSQRSYQIVFSFHCH